jgi:hypothetical protein
MTLTLTPEQERRLTAYAKRKQKPVERVIDEFIADLPQETAQDEPEPKPKTGKELIAYLEKEQVFGNVFADRPEDAPELARILRAEAEKRVQE